MEKWVDHYNNIINEQNGFLDILKTLYRDFLIKYGTKSIITPPDAEEYLFTLKDEGITILYYKSPISEGVDITNKYGCKCLNFNFSAFSSDLRYFSEILDKLEQYIFDNYGIK